MIYNDSYRGLDDLGEAVDRTEKALREIADKFDFIAVRGCSGMLVGAPVALRLGKPIVVVRKPGENSHQWASSVVNEKHAHGRYVFVDDFIATGNTRDAVTEALDGVATPVGTYEYCGNHDWQRRTYNGKLVQFELEDVAA